MRVEGAIVEREQIRAELCDLMKTNEYAFAIGFGCAMGSRAPSEVDLITRCDDLERRSRDLTAVIQEHTTDHKEMP